MGTALQLAQRPVRSWERARRHARVFFKAAWERLKPEPDRIGTIDYPKTRATFMTLGMMVRVSDYSGQAYALLAIGSARSVRFAINGMFRFCEENVSPNDPIVMAVQAQINAGRTDDNAVDNSKPHIRAIRMVADCFDWVVQNIRPSNENAPNHPVATLQRREGNCRSKSFVLASLLEASGYRMQILHAAEHFTVRVFIPLSAGDMLLPEYWEIMNYIQARYGDSHVKMRMETNGIWLELDPTMFTAPGKVHRDNEYELSIKYDLRERKVLGFKEEVIAQA